MIIQPKIISIKGNNNFFVWFLCGVHVIVWLQKRCSFNNTKKILILCFIKSFIVSWNRKETKALIYYNFLLFAFMAVILLIFEGEGGRVKKSQKIATDYNRIMHFIHMHVIGYKDIQKEIIPKCFKMRFHDHLPPTKKKDAVGIILIN